MVTVTVCTSWLEASTVSPSPPWVGRIRVVASASIVGFTPPTLSKVRSAFTTLKVLLRKWYVPRSAFMSP